MCARHAPAPGLLAAVLAVLAMSRGAAGHQDNWAVLVSTSRYWLNYRHTANIMSIYRTVKRLGIPDSNVLLMLAEDHACNARNPWKAAVFNNESHAINVYGDSVEVDYKGYEVTVENFLTLLAGRHDASVPRSKRLLSTGSSNVLVYLTGHGGDGFLKFQDTQELMAQDLADALAQMAEQHRYASLLLMVESCQAATLLQRISAPRVIAMASSVKGESSYSYLNDFALGQPVVDRFTHLTLGFADQLHLSSTTSLAELMAAYTYERLDSTFAYRVTAGLDAPLSRVRVTDFFGGLAPVRPLQLAYPLPSFTPTG